MRTGTGVFLAVFLAQAVAHAEPRRPVPTKLQVAEGVYLFTTPSYGDVGLDGNSVVVLSSDGVLVFDTNGTPAAASAVLAEIRKMTDQPVRFVVNSHWHWDHWYGTEVYKAAFPTVQIIAHEKTREMMMGPALAFNQPGLDAQLPGYIASLEKRAAAAASASPPPADLARVRQLLEDDRFFLEQKRAVRHTFPSLTFTDRLTLHLGGREIQILHFDRAVTPGDAFLYMPKERIVITGDLLVNPISFALSCYPSGWLHTLEKIDALDAATFVPGHGQPLHDRELLHATMDVFRELLSQGKDLKAKGMDVDRAREAILPSLKVPMTAITHGDPALREPFAVQLVDWYLHRVYEELDGPLSDKIGAIPRG
jgi:cyclase